MDENKTYTNRELYLLIDKNNQVNLEQHKAVIDSVYNFHETTRKDLVELKDTLCKVLKQTEKTNGSVLRLLLWKAGVEGKIWIIPILISAIALTINFLR